MKQNRQVLRSTTRPCTKLKLAPAPPIPPKYPSVSPANELHVSVEPIRKLYTDNTFRFPIRSRHVNQYIMIAYHCNSNAIIQAPFQNKKETHCIASYSSIMKRLKSRGHSIDLQILENESSAEYRRAIEEEWQVKLQLVLPDVYRHNAPERSVQTFKAHFLYVLAGVNPTFSKYLRDLLLYQTEITINLLRQATLDTSVFAWEYFDVPHSYDATPLAPLGCKFLIHNKPNTCKSWKFRAPDGFNIRPALHHYRCFHIVNHTTKASLFSDTIKFHHSYLTQTSLTPSNRITNALSILACALHDLPKITCKTQLDAIPCIKALFGKWESTATDPRQPPPLFPTKELHQTEITINLLRQATLDTSIFAWEYFDVLRG